MIDDPTVLISVEVVNVAATSVFAVGHCVVPHGGDVGMVVGSVYFLEIIFVIL